MKIRNIFTICLLSIFLVSCQGAKDAFQSKKRSNTNQEFLVEKKQPLTMPPNFEDIPVPISEEQQEISEEEETSEAEITEMLKELEGESNQSSEEISGNLENEREIKFSGNTSYLSTKEIRLPQILKDLDNKQLTKLRGEADKIALKLKHHDPALFSKLLPSSDLSSQIFKLAEDARIEAVGAKHFSGIKNNLQSLIVEQYKETILPIPGGDDKEALVKALHLVIREKITKSDAPSNTSISLEKWRPWINSKIGNLLNQLQENIANQEKFAAKTKELLTDKKPSLNTLTMDQL